MRWSCIVTAALLCALGAPAVLMGQGYGPPVEAKALEITANGPFEVQDEAVSDVRLVGLDEDDVGKIVLHSRIRRISLVKCTITEHLCALVAKAAPRALSVQHCRSTTRRQLVALMGLGSLHEFRLTGDEELNIADSEEPLALASSVRLFGCSAVHGRLFDLVRSALAKCSLLEELELSDVGMASGDPVLLSMRGIKRLILSGNLGVTDRYLVDQVCKVSTLECLKIDRCTQVTVGGLTHLRELKRLTHLSMGGLLFDIEVVAALSTLPGLAAMDVSLTTAPAAALRQLLVLPSLRSLTAIGTCVDDEMLLEVKEDLGRLEHISLAWCEGISDAGARIIARNSMALKTLDVSGCPNISRDGRAALRWILADRGTLLDD